jgi:branched-chain amino acid transport system substrate-binding protein
MEAVSDTLVPDGSTHRWLGPERAVSVHLFCAAVVLATGCGGDDAGDAVTDVIVTRGIYDATGPTLDIGTPYAQGLFDYLDDLNERGGIRGRRVEQEWVEFGYDADRALTAYDSWRAAPTWPQVVTIFGWGTPDTMVLRDVVARDLLPLISASYAGSLSSPVPVRRTITAPDGTEFNIDNPGAPYNFFAGTDYSTSIRLALQFIKDRGGRKVAFAHCSNSYCLDPIPAGRSFAASSGLVVAADILDPGRPAGQQRLELTDPEDEITRKIAAYFAVPGNQDVDWVWVGNTRLTAGHITRAVLSHAPAAKIIINVWGFDEVGGTECGAECVGRVYGLLPFAAFGDAYVDGMEELLRVHERRRRAAGDPLELHSNVRYVQGFASGVMWHAAVESLLAADQPVTGENIKNALEGFRARPTGGLTPPLSFTASDHRPCAGARIYSLNESGKLQFENEISLSLQDEWLGW